MSVKMSAEATEAIALGSTILSGISLGFCIFLLIASLWVHSVPTARHTIDRISFRMMLWSMVFGIGYDICYILLWPKAGAIDPASDRCKVVMYWQTVTMGAVNYFITCIAVNLMLSIRFAFNSTQLRLERWYIGISLFIAFFVPVVPTALGHFGADPVYGSCYFTSTTLKNRVQNFVLDLYLWQVVSTLISCAAVISTLVTLSRSGRATAKALLYQHAIKDGPEPTLETESGQATHPFKRLFQRRRNSGSFQLQDQFINIAIRIALYPVVMVVMNTVLTVGDLYLSVNGEVNTRAEYGLYVVYYILYGSRSLVLAIIGIFVDPGLPRGLRLAWRASRHARKNIDAESSEVKSNDNDLDFASALVSVPFNEPSTAYSPGKSPLGFDRTRKSRRNEKPQGLAQSFGGEDIPGYTKSFHGVTAMSLPEGMTDDVDIDIRRASVAIQPPKEDEKREPGDLPDLEKGRQSASAKRQSRANAETEKERARRQREAEAIRFEELLHRL